MRTLYVHEDDGTLRAATPEEIGATIQRLSAGKLHVRVGSIEIDAQIPGGDSALPAVASFLIGQDANVTIDGQPYAERTGLRLHRLTIEIAHNEMLKVIVEGTPR